MKKSFLCSILLILGIFIFADENILSGQGKNTISNNVYKVVFKYQNLLPSNFNKEDILFTVYKNGQKYDEQKIKNVLRNVHGLQQTASYYYWGTCKAIYDKGLILNTVEGYKIYNFETKMFLPLIDKRHTTSWTQKEIMHHSLMLISSNGSIENYSYFDFDPSVGKIVGATIGKTEHRASSPLYNKPISISAPLLYWTISGNGVLVIARNPSDFSRNNVKLYKIFIDEKNEILYAIQNNKFVRYKYSNED